MLEIEPRFATKTRELLSRFPRTGLIVVVGIFGIFSLRISLAVFVDGNISKPGGGVLVETEELSAPWKLVSYSHWDWPNTIG